ncbi:ABC transporter ATP-binding protein [Galactobacter caseinivorans]|uniref:ATP-binding cassette domain-containing protein n=1 Tax=Galactobacter caseinivorans TaxID=2676123 RepID=A0A496PHE5_9MICC|nr:ABC transporter ATP-binding protein [Galactobacter caseinivorans]RKW69906.1 ATP-binding cassette domain-containing protein [Galactobacter caseinivorans]
MLEIQKLSKTFFPGTVNERKALQGINLTLNDGDFVTVIGSNGAGKSTLLNMIGGRLRPDTGSVSTDGRNVTKIPEHRRARWVGRVFQDPMAGTAPHLSVEENLSVAAGRTRLRSLQPGVSRKDRAWFVKELASLELGLENRLKAEVGLLSGGQRQALSLLMATMTHPSILLLDEHTAALDPQRAALVSGLTGAIVERDKLTTLMVTHNMEQALQLGNRLIMMHEGRIILEVTEERKAQMTVKDLLGEFDKLKGVVLSDATLLQ